MKKIGKIVLCLTMVSSILTTMSTNVQAEDIDLENGLIGYYDFEDVNDKIIPNVAGHDLKGQLVGSNVSIKESKLGKSLHFSNGEDGHMLISDAINSNANDFSISMWYKYDTTFDREEKNTVLVQQSDNGRTVLSLKADNKYTSFINATNVDSQSSIDVENWQHVTYVYSPVNKKISYYINGILDSQQASGDSIVDSVTDLLIGRHKNGGIDPLSMRGFVDEIRYYNKAVNETEAKAIYEDKAGVFLFNELTAIITDAETLYQSNKLENTSTEAVALSQSIEKAKGLSADNAVKEIKEVIELLSQTMKNYQLAIRINLNININKLERTIDDSIFGINHRYAFNGYGSFDSANMRMKDDFVNLYKASNFGSLRYPGGTISNLFQWKGSIGPLENRTKQIHGFYNNPNQHGVLPTFGIGELGTFADEVNSEIVYVYGFGRGSAQDAADLVEYLNAPVGTNPNGGVAWADVRAKNGHEEPFNVRYFEIGNENNQGGTDGTTSQQYWTQFVDEGAEDAYIEGGLVKINRQYAVLKDDWNKAVSDSDGKANQKRYMRYANPNPMSGDGTELDNDFKAVVEDSVAVFVDGEQWNKVDSLTNAKSSDKVYTIDYRDGSFAFGNGVNGMIPPEGKEIRVSYQVQRDGFVDIAKAMKETMKEIDSTKECNTYSSFETQGFVTKMAARGYNDYYDGLTIHPYSGTPDGSSDNPEVFYDSAMKKAETAGIQHVQDYVNMMPEGKVPVISEYGIFRSTDSLVRSQTHALYIAKVMMEYVRLGSPYIQKHCLVDWYSTGADSLGPTQQAVIQAVPQNGADTVTGEGEFKFFATPSAKVFEMINNNFGNNILEAEFDQVGKMQNGVSLYSTLVSKDDDGNIFVAIVNVDRTNTKKIKMNLNGFDATQKKVQIQTLSGDSYTDENTLENPDNVAIEKSEFINNQSSVDVDLQPHSFTIIKIENPKEPTLASLSISKLPAKLEYELNEELDLNGLVVEATYSDNSKVNVTEYQVSGYNKEKTGKQTITVSYQGLQDTFEVTVKEPVKVLDRIEITNLPDKLTYKLNEELDLDGLVVEATYSDNSKLNVTEYQVSGYNKEKTGKQTITVSFQGKQATFNITVVTIAEKVQLEELINQINNLTPSKYTEVTWNALKQTLSEAEKLLNNQNATQKQIDKAYDDLLVAFHNLRLNRDSLNELISETDKLDASQYTQSSWDNLINFLNVAKTVLSNQSATEAEINKAEADLTKALAELKKKSDVPNLDKDNDKKPTVTSDNTTIMFTLSLAVLSLAGLWYSRKKKVNKSFHEKS